MINNASIVVSTEYWILFRKKTDDDESWLITVESGFDNGWSLIIMNHEW